MASDTEARATPATDDRPTPTPPPGVDAAWAAGASARLVAATRPESLLALGRELDVLLPKPGRRVLAAFTPECPRAPVKVAGPAASGAELAHLAEVVEAPGWAVLRAPLAGATRDILAVAVPAAIHRDTGLASLFAIETDGCIPDPAVVEAVAGMCAVLAAIYAARADETDPATLTENVAAVQERARTIGEMSEAHEAALTAILSALRSARLDDATARAAATEAASSALVQLRSVGDRDRALSEIPAEAAFDRLVRELRPLGRNAGVSLELAGPDQPRILPVEVANGARAVSRGLVVALLDQPVLSRLRVSWAPSADALTVVVRDDGPGELTPEALTTHRTSDRVAALDGTLTLDATPGWGSMIAVELPLVPLASPERNPLIVLNPREREVLAEVARGHRNRDVAETLSISANTVKFHMGNILRKLGVGTRGEAALLARDHGLLSAT